ncbi:MAG: hypothetical protein IJ927_01185, partial [Eubacterium sp.]|nr:hypothetical protein [Eubacterium sp.]
MDIDIKLTAHAKDYIDDLARGVNPFTKENVADEDIINNVKISRCLFYVSDILGEVISNGGINAKRISKPKQDSFDVEKLDLDNFTHSVQPIPVSAIANKINELKPENMKKLKTTAITNWLVDINMLSVVQING